MSGSVLANAIWTAIKADTGATYTPAQDAAGLAKWTIIATEIINHITTNAQVTVTVTSVSGVTTGPGVSGPGAGTGLIS